MLKQWHLLGSESAKFIELFEFCQRYYLDIIHIPRSNAVIQAVGNEARAGKLDTKESSLVVDQEESACCNHTEVDPEKRSGEFVRIIRDVGKEEVDPYQLTLAFDEQIGPGLIYCYPLFGERKVNIEDLYVNDSDQVWKFKGTALKRGKGKGLQSQKVGICHFCVKNAVKLRDAKEERIGKESSEESEIRTKMHKGRDRETILYNLKLIASYCLKYVRSNKNIRNYLDLYPVLWNSSGGGSLLYTSVDQAALSEQGQYVDKDSTCTSPHKEKGKDISAIINTLTRKRQTAEILRFESKKTA